MERANRICCTWAWAAVVYLALAPAAVGETGDLALPNPGFEIDANGDGVPDNWSFSWRSTHHGNGKRGVVKHEPDWGWDRQIRHTGKASIRCGVTRADDDGVWTQNGVRLPSGAKFLEVTAWCRAADVKDGTGNVALVFLGAKGKWLAANYHAITVHKDCDWTQFTGYAAVPKGAKTLRVRCWVNFRYTGVGTFWFDDLAITPVDKMVEPKTVYVDDATPPDPTGEERARGFIVFRRNWTRVLFPNAIPRSDERIDALSIAACPGEVEPAVFAVRALRDLTDLRVTVSDLKGGAHVIPSAAVDVRSVRLHPKRGQSRWGPFNETLMHVPLFLEKRDRLSLAASRSQPFWLTVHAPCDAPPGSYRGTAIVSAGKGPRASLPLLVEVRPFRLAEPKGVTFAMYTRMRTDPAWIRETFADMRVHGMTSVALCGNSGLSMRVDDGAVHVEWDGTSALERNMDAYKRVGFPEPMVWLMGGDIPKFCQSVAPFGSEGFARAYRQVITHIIAHGRRVGWPEIIYQPVDEPFEHDSRLSRAVRLLRLLKSIPGVRTEEDGMNGRWENFTDEVYRLTDVLVLHDGPTLHRGQLDMAEWWRFHKRAVADGKTLWFYNIDLTAWHPEPVRFMTGFGLWKSKATGVIEWAYMWSVKEDDPGAIYAQPKALLYRFPRAPGESGGPTIGYEAAREGIDDFRYLLTLHQLVQRAKSSGKPRAIRLADDVWRPVQIMLDAASFEGCKGRAAQGNWTGHCEIRPDGNRVVRGDFKIANGWQFGDADHLRRRIATGIVRLRRISQD